MSNRSARAHSVHAAIHSHIHRHLNKYKVALLCAIVLLIVIWKSEDKFGVAALAYKFAELFGDVVADRCFPDTFLRE